MYMRKYSKVILMMLLVFFFAGCDQITKSIAKRELKFSASVNLLGGFVRLQYAENEGAFLSAGSGLPAEIRRRMIVLLTVLVLTGFVVLFSFAQKIKYSSLVPFSLLLAGSLGNVLDRLLNHGRVVDFLIVGTKTIHTGILNVADLLITTSVVVLCYTELFHRRGRSALK